MNFRSLFIALAACLLLVSKTAAVDLHTFATTFTVDISKGDIADSSISIGDSFDVVFTFDFDALETSMNVNSAIYNAGGFTLDSITRNPGNAGDFAPTWISQATGLSVHDVVGQTHVMLINAPNSPTTVDIENSSDTPFFSIVNISFYPVVAYDNSGGVGTPLSNFMTPSGDWLVFHMNLQFETPSMDVWTALGTAGAVTPIPEPSITALGLLALGAMGVREMRRRRRSKTWLACRAQRHPEESCGVSVVMSGINPHRLGLPGTRESTLHVKIVQELFLFYSDEHR